jgi:putative ABC transporter-associated repeat protein
MRPRAWNRWAAAGAALTVAVLASIWSVSGAAAADPPVSAQRRVLNDVHTDTLDVQYSDGNLRLQTRIGHEPFEYEDPARLIFQLRDTPDTQVQVPEDDTYRFLGAPGVPVWLAPETQNPAVLWPGFDTESLTPGAFAGDTVDFHLRGVQGPGTVEVFSFNPDGTPARLFSGTDPTYTTYTLQVGVHVHTNWAFTALGWYTLTFEATASTLAGDKVTSGLVDYTWYVGGVEATDIVPVPTTVQLSASPPAPAAGSPVTLTGTVTPSTATGWVEFFDGTTALGSAAVADGIATLTTDTLTPGQHTLTAGFIPAFSNHHGSSTATAVPYTVSPPAETTSPSPSASPSASSSPSRSASPPPATTTAAPTSTAPATTEPPAPDGTTTAPVADRTTCVPTSITTTSGVVLDQGHVDYASRIVGGQLVSQVKDGTQAGKTVWRAPSEVVFHLTDKAAGKVPAGPFDFIGPQGSTIWQIPQTQQQGVLWAGWNTEEVTTAQVNGTVTWKLTAVSGPGALSIFEYDSFGQPKVIFNSKDGLPDTYAIPLGTHAHGNWVFTAAGAYRLTFTQSATLASGTQSSTTQTVTFAVGATDPKALLPKRTTTGGCGGRLATTGVSLRTPLIGAMSMLLAGAILVLLSSARRRRPAAATACTPAAADTTDQ